MIRLVVMTEELSMVECLKRILPRLIPDSWPQAIIIPHEGKSDLEKSVPRKLKAFRNYQNCQYKFVVVRDQDSGNCHTIKESLTSICKEAGGNDVLIRIACHELESWFLGDLQAVERGLEKRNLSRHQNSRKYRNPDHLHCPSGELEMLIKGYRKVEGARKISPYMDFEANKSKSFNVFISGIKAFVMGSQELNKPD